MIQVKEIISLEDARKARQDDLVTVNFIVEGDGGVKSTFRNAGVFYEMNQDSLTLVLPVAGNSHPAIGTGKYYWVDQYDAFISDPRSEFPFKPGSKQFRHYEGLLSKFQEKAQ